MERHEDRQGLLDACVEGVHLYHPKGFSAPAEVVEQGLVIGAVVCHSLEAFDINRSM